MFEYNTIISALDLSMRRKERGPSGIVQHVLIEAEADLSPMDMQRAVCFLFNFPAFF